MKFTGSVGEEHEVVIPREVMEVLRLQPGTQIEVEIHTPVALPPHSFNEERLRAALDKYSGSMREQMLAEGYSSVDGLMDDIRPRW